MRRSFGHLYDMFGDNIDMTPNVNYISGIHYYNTIHRDYYMRQPLRFYSTVVNGVFKKDVSNWSSSLCEKFTESRKSLVKPFKYLIIDDITKKFIFEFDGFCIKNIENKLFNYYIEKFTDETQQTDRIAPLSDAACSEIREILNEITKDSILLLYHKLCRYAEEFLESYSRICNLWPTSRVKSAK